MAVQDLWRNFHNHNRKRSSFPRVFPGKLPRTLQRHIGLHPTGCEGVTELNGTAPAQDGGRYDAMMVRDALFSRFRNCCILSPRTELILLNDEVSDGLESIGIRTIFNLPNIVFLNHENSNPNPIKMFRVTTNAMSTIIKWYRILILLEQLLWNPITKFQLRATKPVGMFTDSNKTRHNFRWDR